MPWFEMRTRFVGTDGQTIVMHMYAISGYNDFWDYVGQIDFDQGAQDCGLLHFGDTPAATNENTFWEAVEFDAADGIGRYCWKCKGYNRFLWICSTLVATSVAIDVRELHSDFSAIGK